MLHLLVDTSVWLDLAKKRDGQKLIHVIGQVMQDGDLELLVPGVVVDEFERNRERIEQSMTTSVAARFKGLRKDLEDLSAESHRRVRRHRRTRARDAPYWRHGDAELHRHPGDTQEG